jgi:hypothetical protein
MGEDTSPHVDLIILYRTHVRAAPIRPPRGPGQTHPFNPPSPRVHPFGSASGRMGGISLYPFFLFSIPNSLRITLLAQCLATTVTDRNTTNTSWQTNAVTDRMGWDLPPIPGIPHNSIPPELSRRGEIRAWVLLLITSRALYQLHELCGSKVFFLACFGPNHLIPTWQRCRILDVCRPLVISLLSLTYTLPKPKFGIESCVCCTLGVCVARGSCRRCRPGA